MKRGWNGAAALVAVALMAMPAPALAVPALPGLAKSEAEVSIRPAEIVYTGDGSAYVAGTGSSARQPGKIHWTLWSASVAVGIGADWRNNCTPDCAQGKYTAYPVTISVYRPRVLGKRLVFTRMTLTYTAAIPNYPAYRSGSWTSRLKHVRSNYFWN